jgi:hypothetical protein
MDNLKPFALLKCDDMQIISDKIYEFCLQNGVIQDAGWRFLDLKALLGAVPELMRFFTQHKLVPRSASITLVKNDNSLPLHVDELPVIAKINMPVRNTQGWVNRWYHLDAADLASCPVKVNQFGVTQEDVTQLPEEKFTLIAEVFDMNQPIVFNSRIPHSVVSNNPEQLPRIIASFTFLKDPVDLLR